MDFKTEQGNYLSRSTHELSKLLLLMDCFFDNENVSVPFMHISSGIFSNWESTINSMSTFFPKFIGLRSTKLFCDSCKQMWTQGENQPYSSIILHVMAWTVFLCLQLTCIYLFVCFVCCLKALDYCGWKQWDLSHSA